jgi:zinc protease
MIRLNLMHYSFSIALRIGNISGSNLASFLSFLCVLCALRESSAFFLQDRSCCHRRTWGLPPIQVRKTQRIHGGRRGRREWGGFGRGGVGLCCRAAAFLVVLALCQGCTSTPQENAPIPARPEQLTLAPVNFSLPQVEPWVLGNGLVVYYVLDDDIPEVRGKIYIPGGDMYDISGITGLAQAAGAQMREGSIAGVSPAELDRHLDLMASSIESEFGRDYGTVSFRCLSEDFEEVFKLFAEVIKQPAFSRDRLELWKKLAADKIRHRRDDPDKMAQMAFLELVYGKGSPYSREPSYQSLKRITVAKMRGFHRQFVRPDGAILVISGAIPAEQAKSALEKQFGDWSRGKTALKKQPEIPHRSVPGVYVLRRKLDQATVYMGHLGPPRHSADQYGILIYNRIFGDGSFGTLLFREIRSRLGLAYSVYGGLWPDTGAGVFQIALATRPGQATQAVQRVLQVVAQTKARSPDAQMVAEAKTSVGRSFLFKFAEPELIVNRIATLRILGYQQDYDETFLSKIGAVSPLEVNEVARRWIMPEQVVIVIVGDVSIEQVKEAMGGQYAVFSIGFDTEPRLGKGR